MKDPPFCLHICETKSNTHERTTILSVVTSIGVNTAQRGYIPPLKPYSSDKENIVKKLLYLIPVLLLVFACGQEEPVADVETEVEIETVEVVEVEEGPVTSVTARHILICYDGCAVEGPFNRTQEEALALIEDIDGRIQSEEFDFTQAAVDYSDCPSSADGGMLGEFGRGAMVPAFEEA
ncbi:MAG: peptidylprolyl isomerase, partial [Candidatus Sabulitectum sp.]|nr:peptidylprolyl isomerase [Candidatus Sabulitectum sp.]